MYTVVETEQFTKWLKSIKDRATRMRLILRIRKASLGNLGDHKLVGDGVWEMREVFGPGWRMYYHYQGSTVIMMLGGGHKASQRKDIALAKALAKELQNEQN